MKTTSPSTSRLFSLLLVCVAGSALYACAGDPPDQSTAPVYVDDDGDGISDGVDTDGDGVTDQAFVCPWCQPGGSPSCASAMIDSNGDGRADGLDTNCDGRIDVPFTSSGSGSTSTSTSTSTKTCRNSFYLNGVFKSLACTSTNGGPATCSCSNGGTTSTCTESQLSCGQGANCCGF